MFKQPNHIRMLHVSDIADHPEVPVRKFPALTSRSVVASAILFIFMY